MCYHTDMASVRLVIFCSISLSVLDSVFAKLVLAVPTHAIVEKFVRTHLGTHFYEHSCTSFGLPACKYHPASTDVSFQSARYRRAPGAQEENDFWCWV